MIRDFWVENYLSISDRQSLSFIAKGPASELITEIGDGVFLYKLAVLYGANASGKSNMLMALDAVFSLLVYPNMLANEKVTMAIPFAATPDKPIKMHVSFYANAIRYDYDVKFNEKAILSESLYYYPNQSRALFYERKFVGDNVQASIKFGASLRLQAKTQDRIQENVLNNHSVLSVCAKNAFQGDIEPFVSLYEWVIKHYHSLDSGNDMGMVEELKEVLKDDRKKTFYKEMLKKADLNIMGFRLVQEDRQISKELRNSIMHGQLPEPIQAELLKPTVESIRFFHATGNDYFEVPLNFQSKGTLVFINILGTLYNLISGNHVYLLDELGEDLHADLLMYYLNVFLFNSEQSQLIITSQEASLLAQDLLNENRGAVWFVEKNRETASSEYSRGDSFGLHKNLSLYNSYKIGRLGSKPEVGSFFIDLD